MICWIHIAKGIPEMESLRKNGSKKVFLKILVYLMIIGTTTPVQDEGKHIKQTGPVASNHGNL